MVFVSVGVVGLLWSGRGLSRRYETSMCAPEGAGPSVLRERRGGPGRFGLHGEEFHQVVTARDQVPLVLGLL